MTHTDFFGNTLREGDTVVLIRPRYRELVRGKVLYFTPCYVFVEYELHYGQQGRKNTAEVKQTGKQLVKEVLAFSDYQGNS